MQEHAGTILTAVIAGLTAVGGLLIYLCRYFAEGKAKAEERTITVLKEASQEAKDRYVEWGKIIGELTRSGEKLGVTIDASSNTTKDISRALEQLNQRVDTLLIKLELSKLTSRSSGSHKLPSREGESR